jgi:glutamate synthase domain-containing protein 3
VAISPLSDPDRELLKKHVGEFVNNFPELNLDPVEIMKKEFVRLSPRSKRPYEKLYTY